MDTFEQILTEEIRKYLGDSGGAYGYQYEKNRENGIMKGIQLCDFSYNDESKECTLYPVIPVYDFLDYNCLETEECHMIQKTLERVLEQRDIDPYSIWEVEEVMKELFNPTWIGPINWEYTYNYDNVLSQDIQFLFFDYDFETEYILLQVHNGCDARSGMTKPRVFKLNDIEYFRPNECNIVCDCDNMSLSYYNYSEICDNGEYIDDHEIYERTYVDEDGNLRCKECNSIIKCEFAEY